MLHRFLSFLLYLGYGGPFLIGVLDSSFLFLPFGNDLAIVILVARHHQGYLLYVLSAVCGSTLGVYFLDLIARKAGEKGVQRIAGERKFNRLKGKIEKNGGRALVVGCLAPPPFPFTMVVAAESALGYPRYRLLSIVAASRCLRFLILGFLALKFGHQIIAVTKSAPFRWSMIVFIALCVIGSIFSIRNWLKGREPRANSAPAHS
ncbi:MAG TPA: VTT domain-containing protein [Bryobacteraceae bacterium]|nr:VTT domain-containing protein [Bryobacteraceae bacterium]